MAEDKPRPSSGEPPAPFPGFGMQNVNERVEPPTALPEPSYQPRATPGAATAALILGICGLVVCPIVCAPLAIVYGRRARGGMARAGTLLGWIGLAWAVLWAIAVVTFAV
ncbi:MAG TPA: DUF4190 domain-containing protein [Solirubrobacter sp.]|nr:DUF4190 domain-containing protein [Solirubrobacter sp.]